MATASMEGAEGHGHRNTNIRVEDAEGLWLGPANTRVMNWRGAEMSSVELEDQQVLTGSSLASRRHTWIPAASGQTHTHHQGRRVLLQQKTEGCCWSTLTLPPNTSVGAAAVPLEQRRSAGRGGSQVRLGPQVKELTG